MVSHTTRGKIPLIQIGFRFRSIRARSGTDPLYNLETDFLPAISSGNFLPETELYFFYQLFIKYYFGKLCEISMKGFQTL